MSDALKGTDFIVHTASPFPLAKPKDEMELIRPAVDGTLAVMEAAKVNKCKKVVITSSVATVMFNETVKDRKLNWNDWSPETIDAYPKSKLLAEKAAWDFIKNLPQQDRFPIVTINPGFILGPNLIEASFTSGDAIKKMLMGEFPGMPKSIMPCVDVRDCALAHLNAIKKPEADNKRIFLSENEYWMTQLGETLNEEFGGGKGYSPTYN